MKLFQYNRALLISFLVCIVLLTASCKKALYVPAEGDLIQLQAESTSIAPGESVIITITGVKASGQPMPDNTLVQMAADSGKFLDPAGNKIAGVRLIGGKAQATFQSDENFTGESVIITAHAGIAVVTPEQLIITIVRIEISKLYMTANPLKLPPSGGTTEIIVTAYDSEQEVVSGKKIFLETTAGTLTPSSPIITDSDGKVAASLETTEPATVTATYKEISKTIEIDVGDNEPPTASFEYSPQNPLMGETIYFVSTSTDSDGTIETYQWSFGDGKESDEQDPSHRYPVTAEEKEYQVVLIVTDDGGKTASAAQTVSFGIVEKIPPVADFTFSPQNPGIGDTVQFTNLSTDEDGTIDSYQWYFGDGGSSTMKNPQHRYNIAEPGVFTVQLTVTDNHGQTGSVAKEITVGDIDNQPPTADFSFTPENPVPGDTIQFLSLSSDEDGTIEHFYWDFGDGDTSTEENPSHYYEIDEPASFPVKLEVTDDSGTKSSITKLVTFTETENEAPVAAFSFSPQDPKTGDIVYFNASASTDSDGEITEYRWDFGDGYTGTWEVTSHTYSVTVTTTFTVILTVVDDKGAEGIASADVTVTVVENQAPVADFIYSPTNPKSGDTVQFNASASSDPDGTIVQYNWDYGDGSAGAGKNTDHIYNVTAETTFTITLTVVDNSGAYTSVSKEITVTP
jgi:PKD repeat protein